MNLLRDLDSGSSNSVNCIVEISKGSIHKTEYDKSTGKLKNDRDIRLRYPFAYGFIPQTLMQDADPADFFLISKSKAKPLEKKICKIIGVIKLKDNKKIDHKLLVVLQNSKLDSIRDLSDSIINQLYTFLSSYKKGIVIEGFYGKREAIKVFSKSKRNYVK